MSRTHVRARITWPRPRNKHLNGEVWGRSDYIVSDATGKVYPRAGGDPVGGPGGKKWAKTEASRIRRRQGAKTLRAHMENCCD